MTFLSQVFITTAALISGLFGDLKWGSGVLWLLLAREAWNLASQLSIRLVSVCIPLSCFVSPLHTILTFVASDSKSFILPEVEKKS